MEEEKIYKILVVDDEDDLCEILKFNLETEGYQVTMANSADDALKLDIASFDLLLLDVMMGGMSGFAMAKQLKANPSTANVPIIFLTAGDTENDTVTGFNLGADDFGHQFHLIILIDGAVKAKAYTLGYLTLAQRMDVDRLAKVDGRSQFYVVQLLGNEALSLTHLCPAGVRHRRRLRRDG